LAPQCSIRYVSIFFADYFARRGATEAGAEARAGLVGFAMIASGGVGSVLAGRWADRLGRERITIWAMAGSGRCGRCPNARPPAGSAAAKG
jgi:MFS family permease